MGVYEIIVIGLFLTNLLVPLFLLTFDLCLSFWTRGRVKTRLFMSLQGKKWKGVIDLVDGVLTWIALDLVAVGLATALLQLSVVCFGGVVFLIIGLIVTLILLPRVFVDLCHSIKFNWKTKDSDRLAKLEKEISALKSAK